MPEPDPDLPIAPGGLLAGKYRLIRVIAKGGMGAIALCHHEELDQRVAIKVLLPEIIKDESSRVRFVREARAAAKLQSVHVARVTDVGTDPVIGPYLVMEYLEGSDLSQLLELRGRLPIHEVVDYVIEAIDAVAEAHSIGIVHRDLKPANLFLAERSDGTRTIKVLDFGISKLLGATAPSHVLTTTTSVVGSPAYMAPEQLRESKGVDARADVWSLGVVLYELLTQALPFDATSIAQLFVEVLEREPVHVRQRRPELPEALAATVMRCLRKDPAARFTTVAHLARALAPFGTGRAASCVQRSGVLLDDALGANGPMTAPLAGSPQAGAAAAVAETRAAAVSHGIVRTSHLPASAALSGAAPVLSATVVAPLLAPRGAVEAHTQSTWGETGTSSLPRLRGSAAAVAAGLAVAVMLLGLGGGLYVRHARHTRAVRATAITTSVVPAESVAATAPTPPTDAIPSAPPPTEAAPPSAAVNTVPSASTAVRAATAGKPHPRGASAAPSSVAAPTPPADFLDQRH